MEHDKRCERFEIARAVDARIRLTDDEKSLIRSPFMPYGIACYCMSRARDKVAETSMVKLNAMASGWVFQQRMQGTKGIQYLEVERDERLLPKEKGANSGPVSGGGQVIQVGAPEYSFNSPQKFILAPNSCVWAENCPGSESQGANLRL
jgi:hypothetical protein